MTPYKIYDRNDYPTYADVAPTSQKSCVPSEATRQKIRAKRKNKKRS